MREIKTYIEKKIMKISRIAFGLKKISSKAYYGSIILIACLTISTFLGEDILKKIEILDDSAYNTIVNLVPGASEFLSSILGKSVVVSLALAAVLSLVLRWFYKKPALLISHTTMGHDLTKIDKRFKKEFYSKKVNMTKLSIPKIADKDSIINAIKEVDSVYLKYKDTVFSEIFYCGVSHIPLVFRLGYNFGQSRKIRFLHRFRKNENDQEFEVLPEEEKNPFKFSAHRVDTENVQGSHDELVVAISTTYPISNTDIKTLDKDGNKLKYIFEAENSTKGFDFFSSIERIQFFADGFIDEIRKLVKKYNISTIHILISSSVPFTFYLAQQMNTQQFPKIIVYQYENQKYRWGINVAEKDPQKAIVWITE